MCKNQACRYSIKSSASYCVDLRQKGSVYRKIFWTRLWSPISISRPLGREIEKLEIGLVQKIFRYTDPFPLRSTIHIGTNKQSVKFIYSEKAKKFMNFNFYNSNRYLTRGFVSSFCILELLERVLGHFPTVLNTLSSKAKKWKGMSNQIIKVHV